VEDLNLTRSNDPVELDAPPITMMVADQDHIKGLVAFYPTSKIRHCTYPERTWEIIPWFKQYNLADNWYDPFGDFHTISFAIAFLSEEWMSARSRNIAVTRSSGSKAII
jgi:hypothetical protein